MREPRPWEGLDGDLGRRDLDVGDICDKADWLLVDKTLLRWLLGTHSFGASFLVSRNLHPSILEMDLLEHAQLL